MKIAIIYFCLSHTWLTCQVDNRYATLQKHSQQLFDFNVTTFFWFPNLCPYYSHYMRSKYIHNNNKKQKVATKKQLLPFNRGYSTQCKILHIVSNSISGWKTEQRIQSDRKLLIATSDAATEKTHKQDINS